MTALPSPGKVIRTIFQYSDQSDTNILNRTHFSYTGSVSSADLTTINTAMGTEFGSVMKGYMTTRYTLESITSTDLYSDTGAEVTTTIGTAGTNSGNNMPSSTCLILKADISRRYRGGHPRVYLTGFPTSYLATADTWNTTEAGDILVAWVDMLGEVTSSPPSDLGTVANVSVGYYHSFTAVENPLTHRYRNVPTLLATPYVDVINSWSYNDKVGSQRRRNEQRG